MVKTTKQRGRIMKKEEDDYLLFYLFCKFFNPQDIMFSGDNYKWTDNPKGIMLDNKIYDTQPFKTHSANVLSVLFELLNLLHFKNGVQFKLFSTKGIYIPIIDSFTGAYVSGKNKLTKKKNKITKRNQKNRSKNKRNKKSKNKSKGKGKK
jgi:hypothetical protein